MFSDVAGQNVLSHLFPSTFLTYKPKLLKSEFRVIVQGMGES